ncbi:MAG: PspA/IM30 family protein [Myxococcota bacterium]
MKWIDRLTMLVKADAHGVLEQLEERSLLAKQHLREAELELTRKRARCEALDDEARRAREQGERLAAEIAALDEDVELALAGDKEELARFALRKLLPKRRALEQLTQRAAEVQEERARLAAKLEEQEAELEELARQVRLRLAADRESEQADAAPERPAADEEIELELLRRRTAGAEAVR